MPSSSDNLMTLDLPQRLEQCSAHSERLTNTNIIIITITSTEPRRFSVGSRPLPEGAWRGPGRRERGRGGAGPADGGAASGGMAGPSPVQIREANAHLAAVHRRAAELEARLGAAERTVREQAESLIRKDDQLRGALRDLAQAKDSPRVTDVEGRKRTAAMETGRDPIEKLRAQCLARGASGIKGLARFFRRLDTDKSQALDAAELQQGLAELGLHLEAAEVEQLCKRYDRDGSGTVDLEEFLRAVRPPMSRAREEVVAAAFAKLDRSGDGVVTVGDLQGVYSGQSHPKVRSGEWTEEQVLRHFLDNFDSPDKDGQVTAEEFLDYYSGVSTSVNTDEEFVAMVQSAWRL
uniref:EF-hand domain-containing protein n=3 Tax=Ornithorhynchus anatinus TaxID=9258 RepID=F7DSR6_ORNAN